MEERIAPFGYIITRDGTVNKEILFPERAGAVASIFDSPGGINRSINRCQN
jgi:hypothetical protein